MYSIERYHDISTGHRVYGHESKCAHLHGHNYRIYFTVESETKVFGAELDGVGRVVDFSVVKSQLCEWLEREWDHKFLVWKQDPLHLYLWELDREGVVIVPFNPTAENMARYLVEVVAPRELDGYGVELVSCRIEETRKCSATYEL